MNNILNEEIEKANTICILGHTNPDGDCLGSTLAIYNYILKKYKDKKVKVYLDKASDKFKVLPGFDKISQDLNDAINYDLCIVCDCASKERVKDFIIYLDNAKEMFVIDHHETNNINSKISIIDKDAPATCELIYDLLDKDYIDKDIATCLYVGLATDTGVFRYCATTKKTMEIAGELMEKGLCITHLLDTVIFMQTFNQKKLLARVIEKAKFLCNGKVIFTYTDENELKELGVERKDIDIVVGFMRETENVDMAVFAYEIGKNIYKVSLRSNTDKINCAQIASKYAGGGHIRAAGFTLKCDIENIKNEIEKIYKEVSSNA